MASRNLSRTTGSVVLQVGALEQLLRYSMNSGRATSVLSSLHEFRVKEADEAGGKQWNWKYLRLPPVRLTSPEERMGKKLRKTSNIQTDITIQTFRSLGLVSLRCFSTQRTVKSVSYLLKDQFDQKDLEGLYRKYDDKLRETLIHIYLSLLVLFSTSHIILVMVITFIQPMLWTSTYLSIGLYILRVTIPVICLCKKVYEPLKRKWFWTPIFVTFVITVDLLVTDIAVTILVSLDGVSLRPAYATMSLLSVYIFLPMRNNFLAIILGVLVSIAYVLAYALFTYTEDPDYGAVVSADIVYLIGVNLMGVYFRLMNEIVTRRSFLDRRACVESTLRLKFVKEQEERLMLSILPEHIVSRVHKDIRAMYLGLQSRSHTYNMRSFNQLYVEEHDNVSILYADVVNYTQISTTLSPLRMVELLNELFGRFDEASEEYEVLRIKFLGDCYYCVSGIPKPTIQHAKNCVDLGLEMIHIIKDVREKRSLNIDMRIGVHSGKILCGLIGIRKWQFDIWSKDVTIANKMESTGQAGKVHVTKQTLELLLDYAREYIIEPNFASQNDEFLMKNKLETYLLSRPPRPPIEYKPFRRASVGFNKIIKKNNRRSESRTSTNFRRTTTFMDENLVEYQQMLKAADTQMEKEIEDMTSGGDHSKKENLLNMFTLMYKDLSLEKGFLLSPDPLFKYYISCVLVILILISIITGLTTSWLTNFPWYAWTAFIALVVGVIVMQPLTWFQFLWTKYRGYDEPRNRHLRKLYDTSAKIIKSAKIRTLVYFFISLGLAAMSVANVIACNEEFLGPTNEFFSSNCVSSWHVTQCWGLALLLNFLFSRIFFMFKWVVAGGMTIFYLWVVWEIKSSLFAEDTSWNAGLDPRISHTLSVVFIAITLYWIDRTTEYRNRLDHMWQIQLSSEQQEAETMLKVNNMLLENILPAHVVQVYLDLNRSIDELYYEKYDNVAVMFASLTDYKLGVEDDAELSDKFFLSILDEVISDFDRLLLTGTSAYKVEKIKMAGWTYMAACGLDPNRRDSLDTGSFDSLIDRRHNSPYNKAIVLTMVEFAAAMMMQLQNFNRGSFQSFEGLNLRIGISNGEVAAGVVGSLKPLYDIWGHAVNMASRMDSTGETGKIQVTETTAKILDECGILTTNRGETFVKGAGYIKTYFVPLDENFNLIKKEDSIDFYRIEDRNRYYNIKNSIFESSYESGEKNGDDYLTYGVRNLSYSSDDKYDGFDEDFLYTDDNYADDIEEQRTITPSDITSYMSSEPEVIETKM